MKICDGYTQVAVREETLLEYRPMLRAERMAVLTAACDLPPHTRWNFVARHLEEHIIRGPALIRAAKGTFAWAYKLIIGRGRAEQERADERNLYDGVRLKLLYPHLSSATCDYCRKWWFDPIAGQTYSQDGQPLERTEEELLCQTPAGCPIGSPDKKRTLSEKNQLAFEFDLHCRATGRWPEDPIVKRNAYIIGLAARRVSEEHNERSAAARRFAGR
jgi:hypothetical protein